MPSAGDAFVSVHPEMAGFQKELSTGVTGAATTSTKQVSSTMSKSFSGIGGRVAKSFLIGFGAVQVARKVVSFVSDSINAASALGEALNKNREVFQEFADETIAWSETTASSFGITQQEALDMTANFGQMFKVAGIATDRAGEMAMAMAELAADMASFNDQDPSEMLQRLQSGLAGQARPLRSFGVFLSEAAIKEQALKDGLIETNREMTDSEKILARYNLILEQTTTQQGDFARTLGESLPNQLRVMKAELESAKVELGQKLLPIMVELVRFARNDLIPALSWTAEHLGTIAKVVGAIVAANMLSKMAVGLHAIATGNAAILATLEGGFLMRFFAMLSAPGFAAVALVLIGSEILKNNVALEENAGFWERLAHVTDDVWNPVAKNAEEALARMSDGTGQVAEGARIVAVRLSDGASIMLNYATMTDEAGRAVVRLEDGTFAYATSVGKAGGATRGAITPTAELMSTQKGLQEALELTNAELNEQLNLLLQIAGGASSIIGSMRSYTDALASRKEAQDEVNKLEDRGRQGTEKYKEAVDNLEDANKGVLDSFIKLQETVIASDVPFKEARDTIVDIAKQAGLGKADRQALIDDLKDAYAAANDFKGRYTADLYADATQAYQTITDLKQQFGDLTARDYWVNVKVTTSGGSTGFHLLGELREELDSFEKKDWRANVDVQAPGLRWTEWPRVTPTDRRALSRDDGGGRRGMPGREEFEVTVDNRIYLDSDQIERGRRRAMARRRA